VQDQGRNKYAREGGGASPFPPPPPHPANLVVHARRPREPQTDARHPEKYIDGIRPARPPALLRREGAVALKQEAPADLSPTRKAGGLKWRTAFPHSAVAPSARARPG